MLTLFQSRTSHKKSDETSKAVLPTKRKTPPSLILGASPKKKVRQPRLNPQVPDHWTKFSKSNSNRQPKAAHQGLCLSRNHRRLTHPNHRLLPLKKFWPQGRPVWKTNHPRGAPTLQSKNGCSSIPKRLNRWSLSYKPSFLSLSRKRMKSKRQPFSMGST